VVTLRDFEIEAPKRIAAGKVTLVVRNEGPDDHEFILVPWTVEDLPLRRDGLTVDEDAVEDSALAVVEPFEPNVSEQVPLDLTPGRYRLLCNMSGHYLGGMLREVEVR
jgi:uncharacterized cupredoxin-like copper-binding protein